MNKKTEIRLLILLTLLFASQSALALDCSGLPDWNSAQVYNKDQQVRHAGFGYTANYWTQGNNPADFSGPWQHWVNNGACSGTPVSSSSISSQTSSSSSSAISSSTGGGSCPSYVAGNSYSLGAVVQNGGNAYTCQIPGWCSSPAAWAYAPGTGAHWSDAWTAGGSCGGAPGSSSASSVSSSTSSVSSSSLSSSSSSAGTGNFEMVGYWENWHWPILAPADVPNYTVLNISFPRINSDGSLTLTNADFTQNNPTAAQVAAAKAQGKKVLLSIGGATTPLVLNNQTHEDNFVSSFMAIKNSLGLDGIDIDTEKGLYTAPNGLINEANPQYSADHLVRAIKRLKAHYGASFLVTMAPETAHTIGAQLPGNWLGQYNWGVYLPLMNALRNEISWVQMQYYNSGSMPGRNGNYYNAATQDGLVAWTEALIEGFPIASTGVHYQGLPANKVVIGLPASQAPSAAGSGYTDPTVVKAAVRCLRSGDCGSGYQPAKTYPDLRGLMSWSVQEDRQVNYFFSNSVSSCALNNQCW